MLLVAICVHRAGGFIHSGVDLVEAVCVYSNNQHNVALLQAGY